MVPDASLEGRITAAIDQFSAKQNRLARFILHNKYFVSFASSSQVAEKTGVSAATVVRTAQSLGYEGYSELQAAIRAELPSYVTAVNRMQEQLAAPLADNSHPRQVFRTDIKNIERTASQLDDQRLKAALEQIVQAERILVIGSGLSAGAAVYLAHSLKVIGFDATASTDSGLSCVAEIARLRPGQLLIVVGLWRYVSTTVQAVQTAREHGVPSIAITDSIASPLASLADFAFEVTTEGVAHSLSLTAVISLVNVMITALSYRIPEQVMESLRRVNAAYQASRLLVAE